ncbi:uncharacterized protein LOC107398657 [Tribolium castaneum]|uniref:Tetraspanin n=1 Tax=Tribolium castaneum TaxID=7070 RepID=A0A139WBI4_TRICA|nr:PREDICTED: uncharacterized protein LOC107398657 [Tribolium castaneum]KYB25328.1 hypothetical protein TcasGA2_TC034422 [Tribolium castaneum]|eukprot:XP_015838992.1 PREDICTED: uncharacterized protein LOC107398657 [Tribolium castaneum]
MNKIVLMSFLRHVIFLLFVIKTINGLIIMFSAEYCFKLFRRSEILPLDGTKPQHAIFVTIDFVTVIFNGFGCLTVLAGLTGFVGAICLNKYPMINFSAGVLFILLAVADFGSMVATHVVINSLNAIVVEDMKDLFKSSRDVVRGPKETISEIQRKYKASMIDGWGKIATGNAHNHSLIDYIQMNQKCCGVTGRHFWLIMVPTSCCPDGYDDNTCNFATAYNSNCMQSYDNFVATLVTIGIQFFFFGVFSVLTFFCSLYLARLKIKYPEDKYDSEDDSSSGSDDYQY